MSAQSETVDARGEVVASPVVTLRPVLPKVLTDRATAAAAVRVAGARAGHAAGFHAAHLPVYLVRLLVRVPVGVGRIVAAVWRWVVDDEHRDAYREAIRGKADPNAYRNLRSDHREQTKRRFYAVLAALFALAVATMIVERQLPPAGDWAALAGVLAVLGVVGRQQEARIVERAAETADVPPLTAELITSALATLGLSSINAALREDPRAVRYQSIVRDGPGYRADIDLPGGATAGEVIDRRSKLASGLRRPLGCVWPEAAPDVHEGRLVLHVMDKSLSEAKAAAWPLAKSGRVNIFEPFPLGVDQRGKRVDVTLMYASGLIGAVPRMGKTATLRLLLLAGALDPRVQLHAFNLKGGSDLDAMEHVAHTYRSGDDPEDLEVLRATLRRVQADMRARYKTIRTLPREVCPDAKVTDQLASRSDLDLRPVIVAMDETQIAFEHPEYGKELAELVTDLVKRGPAVGVMCWAATQRPDAKSIPTSVSANAILRICLKVLGQVENDMVLGTSSYKAGVRATMFGRKDVGIAYLSGEGDDPVIVRTFYVDNPTADKIALRARAVRETAGLLTGQAAGDEPADTDTSTVLDHLLEAWPGDEAKVWCDELAQRLAEARPVLYAGWTGEQVTFAVKPHGVTTVQVKRLIDGKQVNRRGLVRDDLTRATAA